MGGGKRGKGQGILGKGGIFHKILGGEKIFSWHMEGRAYKIGRVRGGIEKNTWNCAKRQTEKSSFYIKLP